VNQLLGRRLPDGEHLDDAEPGDYWFHDGAPDEGRVLWIRDPFGMFGRCPLHTVTENPDGTVTVMPSILNDRPGTGGQFHGFVTNGWWTW
jgi:hypothetical protein